MADYYTYHHQVTVRKRRRRAVLAALAVLALLCAAAGWFYFSRDEEKDGPDLPVAAPLAGSGAASSAAASQPAAPQADTAAYTPRRLLPAADTAAWDTATPLPATTDAGYYNTDFRMVGVPELGLVAPSYFNTVTLVGDSLTEGFGIYQSLPGAFCAGYRNAGPEVIVNNATMINYAMGREKQPTLDTIVATQPDNVYITLGTNSLVSTAENVQKNFIDNFERLINVLHERLPGVTLYVESIPGVQAWAPTSKGWAGLDNGRIWDTNNMLANMALRMGCYFVNVQEALCTPDGIQREEYEGDGVHMNPSGYRAWAEYLSTHTVWNRRTLYNGISPYYIYGR